MYRKKESLHEIRGREKKSFKIALEESFVFISKARSIFTLVKT